MSSVGRIAVAVLLAATLGVPFLLAPPEARPPSDALELVIISPHSESIKFEFARAFDAWHREQFAGRAVAVSYRDIGGSSEIRRFLKSEYEAVGQTGGVAIDLIWGGGAYDFVGHANDGYLDPYPREQLEAHLPELFANLPRKYPALVTLDKYYQAYDEQYRWFGSCLSSFGIVYNRPLCERLKLPPPNEWKDLAEPGFFRQVGLGDPTQTGSIAKCFHTIAARYPWAEAMRIITRMGANARYFTPSAGRVPQDVGLPDIAAGIAIDYYARTQASAYDDGRLVFKAAADGPAIDADPIGILRGAPHRDLARRFVRFVLSKQGQRLWAYRKGEPGGPTRYEIRRPPIRLDLYTPEEMAHFRDAEDIYRIAREAATQPKREGIYIPSFGRFRVLVRHMIIEPHAELVEAWQAVMRHPEGSALRKELEAEFDEVVVTPEELKASKPKFADPLEQLRLRNDWTRRFQAKYRRVVRKARDL